MPRKMNRYQTSLGFYDPAIATPSVKAALEREEHHRATSI